MQLTSPVQLPSLRACQHFVNLTNGLEALPALRGAGLPVGFVRIQSTLCEQGRLEAVVNGLDASLLLHLASGHCCLIYDYASRNKKRGAPRAVWMGLEFIRFALARVWLRRPAEAACRGHNVTAAFEARVQAFSEPTKRRLRYFAQFMPAAGLQAVQLYGVCTATEHDLDAEFYRDIARACLDPAATGCLPAAAARGQGGQAHSVLDLPADVAVQEVLGARLLAGGVSDAAAYRWAASKGGGAGPPAPSLR